MSYIYDRLQPVEHEHAHVSFDTGGLAAINIGLESFYQSLLTQGGTAVHVEWQPPAGGDERLMRILAKMKQHSATGAR